MTRFWAGSHFLSGIFYLLLSSSLILSCSAASDELTGVQAPAEKHAVMDIGPFLPLSTDAQAIRDAAGRQVILRGVQHHALQDVDYKGRDVAPEDYARIALWGFTVLRVAISWSRIEPARGDYDEAYLKEIRATLDAAHAAGLTVILEWHQDAWGRCSQGADGANKSIANGAPDWTCPADFVTSTFGFWELFDHLWANDNGLWDAFTAAWGHVVDRLKDHPAILGWEVMNEPQGQGGVPALERDKIFPAYRKIVPFLRDRGAEGLIFLDASILRNDSYDMYTESWSDMGADIVFAPHLYTGWLRLFLLRKGAPLEEKEKDFGLAHTQSRELGVPVWNGEWGVNFLLPTAMEDLAVHVALEDRYRMGSSFWAFERATAGQANDSVSGGQSMLDSDGNPHMNFLALLGRPYAVQTPGMLSKMHWNAEARRLSVVFQADAKIKAPLVVYVPQRVLGKAICVESATKGDWRWHFKAQGERLLIKPLAAGEYRFTIQSCNQN